MRVPDPIKDCLAHLYVSDKDEPAKMRPVGTAFAVVVSEFIDGEDAIVGYLVTARHVIYGARASGGQLYGRFNRPDKNISEVPLELDAWHCHDETDVAVIPFGYTPDITVRPFSTDLFADENYLNEDRVGAGDDVMMLGLFSRFTGKERTQQVARFGKIALRTDEPIPIKSEPNDYSGEIEVKAYLVETTSWGGESGAPAFLYFEPSRRRWVDSPEAKLFWLLGLVHGHYNIDTDITFLGDVPGPKGRVPVNSGMAVVIPASEILELLHRADVAEERRRIILDNRDELGSVG